MSGVATRRCDVAIAGGGMVGLSLAAALAPLPLDVVVIEPTVADSTLQPSFNSRTTALSAGSRRVLEGIGVWAALAGAATPIRCIHVSERGVFGSARLTAAEQGVEALGYTVENRQLGRALQQRAAVIPRLALCQAGVAGIERRDDAVELVTDSGERIEARLVVAADGAHSVVRAALGIGAQAADYGQRAIVTHVDTTRFHEHTAYERFTPSGPIAALPIAEGRSAIVWTLAPDEASRVLALDDGAFLGELQCAFGGRLGRFTRAGRRQAFALSLTTADALTSPRAAIVGNAAQSLHPVAGQGFNLALRDVAMLAELLAESGAGDPGDEALLARYARWRAPDRRAVIRFTDMLVRGFGVSLPALPGLRGAGLLAFDLLRPVKHAFARRTMGLAGRQPRLVRGLPLTTQRQAADSRS